MLGVVVFKLIILINISVYLHIFQSFLEDIIAISKSFNVDAKVIGRVEGFEGKKLTINSEFGTFIY